jgi:hypothetical protein
VPAEQQLDPPRQLGAGAVVLVGVELVVRPSAAPATPPTAKSASPATKQAESPSARFTT